MEIKNIRSLLRSRTGWFYLLVVTVITVLLFCVSKFVVDNYNFNYNTGEFKLYSLATALADAVLLLSVYWPLPHRHKGWLWAVALLLVLWSVMQVLYIPTYNDIMPWSSFTMVGNLSPLVFKSALGAFRAAHLVLLLPALLALAVWAVWLRRRLREERVSGRLRTAMFAGSLLLYAATRLGLLYYGSGPLLAHDGSLSQRLHSYSQLMGNQNRYFLKFGFVAYAGHAAVRGITAQRHLSDDERRQVEQFLAEQPQYTDNTLAATAAPPRNLLLIIVESLNAWVIDLEINGRPVTPTLNALCADTASLVSLRMKTQVKCGHSSDGHFMYNTGLLPLTDVSVAMDYGNRDYPALAKALAGYDCLEMVCDNLSMWNQLETYRSYGYDRIYTFADLEPVNEQYDYVLDRTLLRTAPNRLRQARQPFFAQMVTLNMHSPYNTLDIIKPDWVSQSTAFTPEVRNYLEATTLFDHELGLFLDQLKAEGLYDNTVIVIASDHTERVDDAPQGRPSLDREGNNCVLIALNTGHGGHIEGVTGQIDVFPTLLDLMGANAYAWKGLGHSLLRPAPRAAATGPDQVEGNATPAQAQRMKQAWNISRLMITKQYFGKTQQP